MSHSFAARVDAIEAFVWECVGDDDEARSPEAVEAEAAIRRRADAIARGQPGYSDRPRTLRPLPRTLGANGDDSLGSERRVEIDEAM